MCAALCAPPPRPPHSCRHPFKLAQDPNSQHLGTTVWDSSIVLAKYLEKVRYAMPVHAWHEQPSPPVLQRRSLSGCLSWRHRPIGAMPTPCWLLSSFNKARGAQNARRGEFARHKMRGKRAAELGAGMGLGGLAFAMLGADVLLTDVAAVLPLLRRNYENNLSPAVLRGERLGSFLNPKCLALSAKSAGPARRSAPRRILQAVDMPEASHVYMFATTRTSVC